jgi:hypothetical protein
MIQMILQTIFARTSTAAAQARSVLQSRGCPLAASAKLERNIRVSMIPGFRATAASPFGNSTASAAIRPSMPHLVAQ